MNNRPQGSVWAKPCPMPTITPLIRRAAAASMRFLPAVVDYLKRAGVKL